MTNKPCKDCGKQNPSDIHTCTPMTKKEPTCDCKNDPNNCPKDCKVHHTHKTVICEICEPNAFKEEEPKQLLTLNNTNNMNITQRLEGLHEIINTPRDVRDKPLTECIEDYFKESMISLLDEIDVDKLDIPGIGGDTDMSWEEIDGYNQAKRELKNQITNLKL